MRFRIFIVFLTVVVWIANGIYAFYVNRLRLEEFKKVEELRRLRRENAKLYWKISKILNYERGIKFAEKNGYVPVKPYRVFNFYPCLKGKPLIDFYTVWFGDTPSKIAEKLGVPLRVLKLYNPSLKWGYVVPGQVLIYPVSFPFAKSHGEDNETDGNGG